MPKLLDQHITVEKAANQIYFKKVTVRKISWKPCRQNLHLVKSYAVFAQLSQKQKLESCPFYARCSLKGHTYLNKPVRFNCRFVQVCVTFQQTPSVKWSIEISRKLVCYEKVSICTDTLIGVSFALYFAVAQLSLNLNCPILNTFERTWSSSFVFHRGNRFSYSLQINVLLEWHFIS